MANPGPRAALLGAILTAALFAACGDDAVPSSDPDCPNIQPEAGDECTAGLTCHYADPNNCAPYYTATCTADGTWALDDPCGESGGAGPVTSTAVSSSSGMGGEGGSTCVDPSPGGPAVTSPLTAVFPPDRTTGSYTLVFDEPIDESDVMAGLTWTGPGTLVSVTKAGAGFRVRYNGMAPGDTATLSVHGVTDACGTPIESPVDITFSLLSSCHLFEEDFEGDIFASGWSAEDDAGDGNVWSLTDTLGVVNHSDGGAIAATTNGVATATSTSWQSNLRAPAIDLTGQSNVVMRFQSAFSDPSGAGEAHLEASADGASWSSLRSWTESRNGLEVVDLSAWSGAPVYLRWRYLNDDATDAYWDVDHVCVEQFTKISCACTADGVTEVNDVLGMTNGNGDVFAADATGAVLSQVGDAVTVCGQLEQGSASGADFFRFLAAPSGGALQARVTYCIENAFQEAQAAAWLKTDPTALAQIPGATNEGSFEFTMSEALDYFVSLDPGTGAYNQSRYRMRVEVLGASTPLLSEGFEVWPPLSFTVGQDDPCVDWKQAPETVQPSGNLPSEGVALAYLNSYDCSSGSEALVSGQLSFAQLNSVVLSIDVFHDTGFPAAQDSVQVEYDTGAGWTPIGDPIVRPGGTTAWETHTVDLSQLAGLGSVQIRLLGTSAYGNHMHIDNIMLLSQ